MGPNRHHEFCVQGKPLPEAIEVFPMQPSAMSINDTSKMESQMEKTTENEMDTLGPFVAECATHSGGNTRRG